MASRTCWICEVSTHMTMVGEAYKGGFSLPGAAAYSDEYVSALYRCDECKAPSIGVAVRERKDQHTAPTHWMAGNLDGSPEPPVKWFPRHVDGKSFPDVPAHIADAASEAFRCSSIEAYRAAVALARAVVEAAAKEKGITKGNLNEKIQTLVDQGHIRPHIGEAAHEIRHFGNGAAHGDFVESVQPAEAEEVLGLVVEVLHEVFQSPAKVQRLRTARKAQNQAS